MLKKTLTLLGLTSAKEDKKSSSMDEFKNSYEQYESRRKEFKTIEIEELIGKPVIGYGNEWDDPLIGIVTRMELISLSKEPMAVVKDIINNNEVLAFCNIMPFTRQRFNAIMKLDPYERWCLTDRVRSTEYRTNEHRSTLELLTKEEIEVILIRNKFPGYTATERYIV